MLLMISDREPLAWLLAEQRFALPRDRPALPPGARLLLYTTRGCYRNRDRDRGLVMGLASARTPTRRLNEPIRFRGRDYPFGFRLNIEGLALPHKGIDLGHMAGLLDALPDPAIWSTRLRRSPLALSARDAALILDRLQPMLRPRREVLAAYIEACKIEAVRERS